MTIDASSASDTAARRRPEEAACVTPQGLASSASDTAARRRPEEAARVTPQGLASSASDTAQLRALAERGAAELGPDATAQELLTWTEKTFGRTGEQGGGYIVASNMQDGVLVHLATQIRPGVDVLFLDTGYHFAETYGTRDAVAGIYGANLVDVEPEHTVAEQDRLLGKDLFARDPNECCRLRKVVPLTRTLSRYSAWVTGIRRVESPTRANAPLISFDEAFGLVKINPIAAWSDDDMARYIEEHAILVNPLVEEGYPSIGCAPCTRRPAPGADPRSGRWAGLAKTECGLHASTSITAEPSPSGVSA